MRDFLTQDIENSSASTAFLDFLAKQRELIAKYSLAAWDGETTDGINSNLDEARVVLLQVIQRAEATGFTALATTAQHFDAQILAHLEGPYADLAICPGEIIWWADTFAESCQSILDRYLPWTTSAHSKY